jgi:hypothetical protein
MRTDSMRSRRTWPWPWQFGAGVEHQAARTAAAGAGALDREEALSGPHAAGAAAGAADRRAGAGLGARAVADLAGDGGGNLDLDLGARIGLLERDLQVVTQVLAALGTVRLATTAAEHLAEHVAKDVVEDIAGVGAAEAALSALRAVHPGMAEAIIGRALLSVGQHRIGFVDFLEARGRVLATAIAVGMVLHRHLAEGDLQGGVIAASGHAQDFVIVAHQGRSPAM